VSSQVQIVNTALISIRAETIALPLESSVVGRKVAVIYPIVLKDMIRAHPWNFAKKETALSRIVETPVLDDDYAYIFTLPSDYLQMNKTSGDSTGYTYRIKNGRLYSNLESLDVEYMFFNEDPNSYDSDFVTALAARLAAELVYSLTSDRNLIKTKWDEFIAKWRQAKASNGFEQSIIAPTSNLFFNARNSSPWYYPNCNL